jgi:glycosyltransferase involved in cell wall biosynthesis
VLKRLKDFEISLPSRYQVDGVMTVSRPLADTFADAGYPKGRLLPIHYGYDAFKFPLRNTSPAAGNPVVIMHGSFDKHHLGSVASDAMVRVNAERPDVVFRFVGKLTAGLKGFVNALRRAAPGIKIECTGFVSYDEMGKHLAEASIGIVPYEESSGTHCAFVAKAVEYLGVGLPVVSTRLKNLSEYFHGESRIRFSEFNGQSFSQELLSWLNDPELGVVNEATRTAAARVREQLDWRSISRCAIDFVEKTRDEFR